MAVVAFVVADRDDITHRVVASQIPRAAVFEDLSRIEHEAELAGFRHVRTWRAERAGRVVDSVHVPDGSCLLVALGAWGLWRVGGANLTSPGRLVHSGLSRPNSPDEVSRTQVKIFCPSAGEPAADSSLHVALRIVDTPGAGHFLITLHSECSV